MYLDVATPALRLDLEVADVLPADLRAGNRLLLRATGAYTATSPSVRTSGFAPLSQVFR